MKLRNRRVVRGKVTLHDVAKKAGVSAITVSRALREPDKVSEALRETILKLIDDMGYMPDLAARALASGSSGFIGVLIPNLSHPAFSLVVQGIEERVRGTDYHIQYANTHYDATEELSRLRSFAAQRPTGIILAGTRNSERVNTLMREASCPIVQTMDCSLKTVGMAVGVDHRAGGRAATRHMLERGYRRFGLLGGGLDVRTRQRLAGYSEVMREAGLYDESQIVWEETPTSVRLGSRLLQRFIEAVPDADGVVCHNDDLALGAIFECQRLGIKVPEDFGICGFNDLDFADLCEPPLTTIKVPLFEIGYRAAGMLIAIGSGQPVREKTVDLGFQLIERCTTRRGVAAVETDLPDPQRQTEPF